jgi:antitoxin component of MazEF toxin-antitoxin module
MVKSLVKHGNSWALVIDKPILELLKIDPTTPLDISTPDGVTLVVRAVVDDEAEQERLLAASLEDINGRYGTMLKRLAS